MSQRLHKHPEIAEVLGWSSELSELSERKLWVFCFGQDSYLEESLSVWLISSCLPPPCFTLTSGEEGGEPSVLVSHQLLRKEK